MSPDRPEWEGYNPALTSDTENPMVWDFWVKCLQQNSANFCKAAWFNLLLDGLDVFVGSIPGTTAISRRCVGDKYIHFS